MSHLPQTDPELLERMKNADARAFDLLFQRHWQKLYRSVLTKTGDEQAAFDIVQDVFVQLWLQRATLEIRESLGQYLSGAIRNQVFNYYRSIRKETDQLKQLSVKLARDMTPENDLDKEDIGSRELALEKAVNSLPDRMKDIYLLRIHHEYSFKDIAETLNIKPQTAKNAFSRAVVLLRENLTEHLIIMLITLALIFQ